MSIAPTIIYVDPAISRLIPSYLEKKRKEIRILDTAIDENDFNSIETIGHQMKGSAASYGFNDLTEVGKSLETAARSRDASGVMRLIEYLKSYLQNIEIRVENEVIRGTESMPGPGSS